MIEFLFSLGVLGWIVLLLVIALVVALIRNPKKLIFLNSPLDSQQHKLYRGTGGGHPEHLDKQMDKKDPSP